MTGSARSWLPAAALMDGRLEAVLGEVVSGWSHAWLGDGGATLAHCKDMPIPDRGIYSTWCSAERQLLIIAERSVRLASGARFLSCQLAEADLEANDPNILDPLFDRAMHDLLNEVECRLLGQAGRTQASQNNARAGKDAIAFEIECGPHCGRFFLTLEQEFAVRARRGLAGTAQSPERFGRLDDAINRQKIEIGARLGVARVTVSDLANLEPGDVLALDRDVTEALEIVVDSKVRPMKICRIQAADDGLELHLTGQKGYAR